VLEGKEPFDAPKTFTFLEKFPPNFRIPLHSHLTTERFVVASGAVYFGHGDREDDAAARKVGQGAVVIVPAGLKHYGFHDGLGGDPRRARRRPAQRAVVSRRSSDEWLITTRCTATARTLWRPQRDLNAVAEDATKRVTIEHPTVGRVISSGLARPRRGFVVASLRPASQSPSSCPGSATIGVKQPKLPEGGWSSG
jgi:hypothetical protein